MYKVTVTSAFTCTFKSGVWREWVVNVCSGEVEEEWLLFVCFMTFLNPVNCLFGKGRPHIFVPIPQMSFVSTSDITHAFGGPLLSK